MKKPFFFADFHWCRIFICKDCKYELTINNKIRYSGGSYLDYAGKSVGLNDAEQAILDNETYFGPNIHYGFQCQDCGLPKNTNNYNDLYYTVETNVTCDCGGSLSRHHPIFCPNCKRHYDETWDAEAYKQQLKEKYELEQKKYQSDSDDGDYEF